MPSSGALVVAVVLVSISWVWLRVGGRRYGLAENPRPTHKRAVVIVVIDAAVLVVGKSA